MEQVSNMVSNSNSHLSFVLPVSRDTGGVCTGAVDLICKLQKSIQTNVTRTKLDESSPHFNTFANK